MCRHAPYRTPLQRRHALQMHFNAALPLVVPSRHCRVVVVGTMRRKGDRPWHATMLIVGLATGQFLVIIAAESYCLCNFISID